MKSSKFKLSAFWQAICPMLYSYQNQLSAGS